MLGTARLLTRSLADARVSVGLSWRNLGHALVNRNEQRSVDPRQWGVLYLGAGKLGDKTRRSGSNPLLAIDRNGEPLADQGVALGGIEGLVALDGNWAQAKALWWRNAWLLKCRRIVLNPQFRSLYGQARKEPRRDSVSTLEAGAFLLSRLEGDQAILDTALKPFSLLLKKLRQPRPRPARPPRGDAGSDADGGGGDSGGED